MARSIWKGPYIQHKLLKKLILVHTEGKAAHTTNPNKSKISKKSSINESLTFKEGQQLTIKKDSIKGLSHSKILNWSRQSTILPAASGKIVEVYDGKKFLAIKITPDMIGHKFGEFSLTRKQPKHKK